MNEYRNEFNEGLREAKWTFWKIFGTILVVVVIISVVGYFLGWFGEGAKVVKDEFGPKAALEKYEWFINQANSIKKMEADITIFESRVTNIKSEYSAYGSDLSKWPLDVRTQYNHSLQLAKDDLVAIVSQRNNLVKDYNSASEKFNWEPFKTRSDFPGKEFVEYKSQLPTQ